jgi:signal peptide peptidase SppA
MERIWNGAHLSRPPLARRGRVAYVGAMRNPLELFRSRDRVSVLRLEGVIGPGGGRLAGPSLSDAGLAPLIESAFRRGRPRAVALAINSPGGSPAQSSLIAARIRRLADEKRLPVHAFVEDVAASGGYWLATAADQIHLDPNSIVGSIGVISASFGFQDLIARHGIERRVHTAGTDKSLLDPFRPERPEDVERLRRLQDRIHANFIAQVRERRGARLNGGDLFDGDIWVGQAGVDAGLADGIGHLVPVMRSLYGEKVQFRLIAPRRPLMRRLGLPGVGEALDAIEARALWTRYGLPAR